MFKASFNLTCLLKYSDLALTLNKTKITLNKNKLWVVNCQDILYLIYKITAER